MFPAQKGNKPRALHGTDNGLRDAYANAVTYEIGPGAKSRVFAGYECKGKDFILATTA